jgi:raffinose/stachyose/melibiose transport system permease protein
LKKALKPYFIVFVLPTFIAFIIGFIYPFLQGIYLSFCNFITINDAKFIGFENYKSVFSDITFGNAFRITIVFALFSIIIINVLSFTIAYFLTSGIKGANAFRTVFFMPNLIGGIVLGYIWILIFDGILQNYNTSIALNEKYGFWGLVILTAWQQIGYMMIIYIAGLQSVGEDIYEAAKIDGANRWQILSKITIPMIMPSITICTFLTLTNSFKLFDQNLALTAGKPGIITENGTTVFFNRAFST